ncbi:MAG: AzlC family ABC transporter permease [Eubacteriales bacterium]|nr:AzlC family ABC transporter permease [Eubacteriales bacterium]
MKSENKTWFARGLRAGVPIGLGYFAVAFTLGIAARSAGLTAFQATLSSLLLNASAGEFVGFTLMSAGAGYLEVAIMEAVANARYLLMSFSLSQKLRPETGLIHRLILGWYVTDEVFGVSISAPGYLNPWYTYGAIALACPGWAAGTCLGVILGNIFPASVVSALSVGLYGMFIAIFVPPAKESRVIRGLVLVSMGLSFFVNRASIFAGMSSGIRTILLTVILSAAAAILFPIREAKNDAA